MEHCDRSGETRHVDVCPCSVCSDTPPRNWRESDAIKQARTWLVEIDDPLWPCYTESDWAQLLRSVLAERDFIGEWLQRCLDANDATEALAGALKEAAVHIAVARGVRHQLPAGDDCPHCKLDQEMLDAIGEALAAHEMQAVGS